VDFAGFLEFRFLDPPGLDGYAWKPQTTAEHTAEHGMSGSKTAEEQCMLNYRCW